MPLSCHRRCSEIEYFDGVCLYVFDAGTGYATMRLRELFLRQGGEPDDAIAQVSFLQLAIWTVQAIVTILFRHRSGSRRRR